MSEAGGERHMDETQDDERATALIAIWYKKDEELFGRRSQIDRACTARSFHVVSRPLDRCTSSMRRLPFRLCGTSERSRRCRRRMHRTIPQNHFSRRSRSLAHREEERTRGHEKTRHFASQSDPTETDRRRDAKQPHRAMAAEARTMT